MNNEPGINQALSVNLNVQELILLTQDLLKDLI